MITTLYKLLDTTDYSNRDDFSKTQVMTEEQLTDLFVWYCQHDYINEQNLKDKGVISQFYTKEDLDSADLSIDIVFSCLAENGDYDPNHTFLIEQFEIEL